MLSFNPARLGCLIGVSALVAACGGAGNETASNEQESTQATVAMNYDVAALLSQNIAGNEALRTAAANQILRGELSATALSGSNAGNVETVTWTINLDDETFVASSNQTLVLSPANYDFELLITEGNQQYAGYSNETIIDGENTLEMTIKPIIGDFLSDVTIIDRLAYFKFAYSTDELAVVADPSMGIQVDGGLEQVFGINPTTGLSETFANLPTGEHTIELALYDGATQVGKSLDAQEAQTVNYGTDLAMDIVPLYGEVQFELTENGGDANIAVTVPAEVIDEVGGVNNLTATLALVGSKNPLQESELYLVQQGDGSYLAEFVLNDLQYDDVNVSVTFTDTTTSDQIATCNNSWTLNNLSQTFNCDITLIRRAVVSGNILAVVGINVENAAGAPVSGAVITNAAEDVLAVTNSGTYGTQGYAKVYLTAGDYTLTATDEATGDLKTVTFTVNPLDVENLTLVLETPPVVEFSYAFNSGNWAFVDNAAYNVTETQFDIFESSVGGGKRAEITVQADGQITFDWSCNITVAGDYGSRCYYLLDGVNTTLSDTVGSANGTVTIDVTAGQVLGLGNWGGTQYSRLSASFSNIAFAEVEPFSYAFDGGNWAFVDNASYTASGSSFSVYESANGGGRRAELTVPADVQLTFNWTCSITVAGDYGSKCYINVDGVQTVLSSAVGTVTGSESIALSAGQVVGLGNWGGTQYSRLTVAFDSVTFSPL